MIIPAAQIKKTDGRDNVRSSGPGAASGVAPSWNAAGLLSKVVFAERLKEAAYFEMN